MELVEPLGWPVSEHWKLFEEYVLLDLLACLHLKKKFLIVLFGHCRNTARLRADSCTCSKFIVKRQGLFAEELPLLVDSQGHQPLRIDDFFMLVLRDHRVQGRGLLQTRYLSQGQFADLDVCKRIKIYLHLLLLMLPLDLYNRLVGV